MLNEVKIIIFIILTIQLYTPLKTKPSHSNPIIQREKSKSAFSATLKGTNPTHKEERMFNVWVCLGAQKCCAVDLAQHTSF